jgi:hypothetical protein
MPTIIFGITEGFEGEGPSPGDISRVYRVGGESPLLGQRYDRELELAYKAGGFTMVEVVATSSATVVTKEMLQVTQAESPASYLGPVLGPEGMVVPGIARWCQQERRTGQQLSSAA